MQATQASTSEHGISDGESVTIDDEGQQDEFEVERILAEYVSFNPHDRLVR